MDTRLTIQGVGVTDVGKKRTGNEDAFYCNMIWDDRHMLAMAIDGCGGYKGGAVCSALTRDAMVEYMTSHADDNRDELLKRAIVYANNKVIKARSQDEALRQMCCVATAVLVDLDNYTMQMAHVGDSRLYASIEGRIIKLSHDHSPVGNDEEEGRITEAEAMSHPHRNVISRAVGEQRLTDDTTYIEYTEYPIAEGLTWLLCSDGLCDMITSAEMNDILCSEGSLQDKAERLVAAANEAGGKDNITVVLLQTEGGNLKQAGAMMDYYASRINPDRTPDYSSLLLNTTMGSASDDYEEIPSDESPTHDMPVSADADPRIPVAQPNDDEQSRNHKDVRPVKQPSTDGPVQDQPESTPDVKAAINSRIKHVLIAVMVMAAFGLGVFGDRLYLHYKELKPKDMNPVPAAVDSMTTVVVPDSTVTDSLIGISSASLPKTDSMSVSIPQ